MWYTEKKPTATEMITAVTVSASRNADSTAAAQQNSSDSADFERTPTRIWVKVTSSSSFMK